MNENICIKVVLHSTLSDAVVGSPLQQIMTIFFLVVFLNNCWIRIHFQCVNEAGHEALRILKTQIPNIHPKLYNYAEVKLLGQLTLVSEWSRVHSLKRLSIELLCVFATSRHTFGDLTKLPSELVPLHSTRMSSNSFS